METQIRESYWSNGKLCYRFHVTNDDKNHGLYELYHEDGNIYYLGYYNMNKLIKLINDYPSYVNRIEIRYYI